MDTGELHEDWSDRPWRCAECGIWNYPDDGEFVLTDGAPVCGRCADPCSEQVLVRREAA